MSKNFLLVNGGAGRARRGNQLKTLLEATGQRPNLEVHVLESGDNVGQIVRRAIQQGAKVVGVAGGDGTINSVASALVDTAIPLVVIPFGTLNHFARDIGVPTQFEPALDLFDSDQQITIDVGEVNGFYFLNNSSVGIYPSLVHQREKYEKRLGKWLAYGLAGWNVLRRPNLMHIKLKVGGQTQDLKVGIIFFSNNRAEVSPLAAGHRPRLDGQILDAFIVEAASPFELFRVTASFLRNRLEQSPLVTRSEVDEAIVYTRRRHLRVACDGEIHRTSSPLNYRIHAEALILKVPPTLEEAAKSEEKAKA